MHPIWSNAVRKAGSTITETRNGRFTYSIAATSNTGSAKAILKTGQPFFGLSSAWQMGRTWEALPIMQTYSDFLSLTPTAESGRMPQRSVSNLWMNGFPQPVRSACPDPLLKAAEQKRGSSTTAAKTLY